MYRGNRMRCLLVALVLVIYGCDEDKTDDDSIVNSVANQDRPGVIYSVSGTGIPGYNGEGVRFSDAQLYWPVNVMADGSDNFYIVDWNNHRVRKCDAQSKQITTVIGSGNLGDGRVGAATQANMNHPTDVLFDPFGNLIVAAWHNWTIKRVHPATGMLDVIAGTVQGYDGDGGPATAGKLNLPSSVAYDDYGNLYISDQGNLRIRKVDPAGMITTYAGTGERGYTGDGGAAIEATFEAPIGSDAPPGFRIAIGRRATTVDAPAAPAHKGQEEYLFVADTNNHCVRVIDIETGVIRTFAGSGKPGYGGDGGPATDATLNSPADVQVAPDSSVFIADTGNHVVRKVDPFGIMTTVAGIGAPGSDGDGSLARHAKLNHPYGIGLSPDGIYLYIADTMNQKVRRVRLY